MPMRLDIYKAELNVLSEMGRIIGRLLEADDPLDRILQILSKHLAMKRALIALVESDTGVLSIRACCGLRSQEKKRIIQSLDKGVMKRVMDSGQSFFLRNGSADPVLLDKGVKLGTLKKEDIALLGASIVASREFVGIFSVDRLFGSEISCAEDIRFLHIIADFISQFILLNQNMKEREGGLKNQNRSLMKEVSEGYNNFVIVCKSKPMIKLQELVEIVATSNSPVMLIGEPGTEKTLVARAIHQLSRRADAPFIKVNCARMPEAFMESELILGFEEAVGGAVFLNEIDALSIASQAKILSLLRDKGCESRETEKKQNETVRIMAGTGEDLSFRVREGAFREDLYYRLNVFPIQVPPLRERRDDIPVLADLFLQKVAKEYGRKLSFTPRAFRVLEEHTWPGNMRELEYMAGLLAVLADEQEIDWNLPALLLMRYAGLGSGPYHKQLWPVCESF